MSAGTLSFVSKLLFLIYQATYVYKIKQLLIIYKYDLLIHNYTHMNPEMKLSEYNALPPP